MSTPYEAIQTEDRRLVVLRSLKESGGYKASEYVLLQLLEYWGHAVATDRLRTDLAWLAEQGLVTGADVAGVQVATLTGRGLDVSLGRAVQPGVKRPMPGA